MNEMNGKEKLRCKQAQAESLHARVITCNLDRLLLEFRILLYPQKKGSQE